MECEGAGSQSQLYWHLRLCPGLEQRVLGSIPGLCSLITRGQHNTVILVYKTTKKRGERRREGEVGVKNQGAFTHFSSACNPSTQWEKEDCKLEAKHYHTEARGLRARACSTAAEYSVTTSKTGLPSPALKRTFKSLTFITLKPF